MQMEKMAEKLAILQTELKELENELVKAKKEKAGVDG